MENLLTKTTDIAMYMTAGYLEDGDFAVDATCGNGHDTLSLSLAVGKSGKVLALDLQEDAVLATRALLDGQGIENVSVRQCNFVDIKKAAQEVCPDRQPSAVIFNLGYLPGGDKCITTRMEDTVTAVAEALALIRPGGIVTAVLYSGHSEGAKEKKALLQMAGALPPDHYHVVYANLLNQKKNPPEVLFITRKK